jgi:hypothetical protein
MSAHLKEIHESYFEHMQFAQKCGWRMVIAGLACVIHSIIPDIFMTTASDTMKELEEEINARKNKPKTPA